jgi:Protein of unknown function (DUF2750)
VADSGRLFAVVKPDPESRSGPAFVFVEGPAGRWYIPIWPHERYAAAWAESGKPQTRPQPIEVDEWLTFWTRRAIQEGIRSLVFPTPEDAGHLVGARDLQRDLLEELSLFEAE